jgi:hypothetical protein
VAASGGRWRVCPAPAPEPKHPYPIPDGRDLRPESVILQPATRGRHLPPGTNALGQHAVLPLPAIQLCRDAVPTLPASLVNRPTGQRVNLVLPLSTCQLAHVSPLKALRP